MKNKCVYENDLYKIVESKLGDNTDYFWSSIDGRYYTARGYATIDEARSSAEVHKPNLIEYMRQNLSFRKHLVEQKNIPDEVNYLHYAEYLSKFAMKVRMKRTDEWDTRQSPMNFEEWVSQMRNDPDSMTGFYDGNLPKLV